MTDQDKQTAETFREEKVARSSKFSQILEELAKATPEIDQREKRKDLLEKIEGLQDEKRRVIAYITRSGATAARIEVSDITPFGTMLDEIGRVENLDLILHSEGGDGTVAEKIGEMCRSHVKNELRVIVPNRAKSAATIVALGADKIVMGPYSELGPIDPQVVIQAYSVPQPISALSIVDARDQLLNKLEEASKEGKSAEPYLVQLATLNVPFLEECNNWIKFSQELAVRWLSQYMLKRKHTQQLNTGVITERELEKEAKSVTDKLTSRKEFFAHGKLIGAKKAQEIGLVVEELGPSDELWQKVWEYYCRVEVGVLTPKTSPARLINTKIIETTKDLLIAQSPVRE